MSYVPLTESDLAPNKPARALSFALRVHTNFEDHQERLNALETAPRYYPLGGSRVISVPQVASAQDVAEWIDFIVPAVSPDLTYLLRVELRTYDSATGVTPRLWNVTDAEEVVLSDTPVECTSETWGGDDSFQEFTFEPEANKRYRLQLTPSDADNPVFGVGHVLITV